MTDVSNGELDPRLLVFLEGFRKRSDTAVSVEGDSAVIGSVPNCAILRGDTALGKIVVSVHFDCHPLSVVNLHTLVLELIGSDDAAFSSCFLTDVNGVLVYEADTGFSLMRLQYLRDVLASQEKDSTAFVS